MGGVLREGPGAPRPPTRAGQGVLGREEDWQGCVQVTLARGCPRRERESQVHTSILLSPWSWAGVWAASGLMLGVALPRVLSQDEIVTDLGPQQTDSISHHPP